MNWRLEALGKMPPTDFDEVGIDSEVIDVLLDECLVRDLHRGLSICRVTHRCRCPLNASKKAPVLRVGLPKA